MADISAARLNNLQARIEAIMGNGAGQNGYGENISSYQVSAGTLIQATDINSIYADIVRARVHQVGVAPPEIQQLISNLNVIADETSFYINDSGITTNDPSGAEKGIADFENLMNSVEADKFLMNISQATLESGTSSSRTTGWNGVIHHTFQVVFTNADHRRHFFNSGGEIRMEVANSSASTAKGRDWEDLCRLVGTVKFNYNSTVTTNSGNGTNIGNYDLTTSYKTIYTKTGTGTYSGVYAGNVFTIKAKEISSSSIEFRLEFNDAVTFNVPSSYVDDNVDGNLSTTIKNYRADTSNVTVAAPTYSTVTGLSSFATPTPPSAPPPPPAPLCTEPALISDSLGVYQPGQVLIYNDGAIFNNRSLTVSTLTSEAATINGWYLSDLGRPAELEGLNYWYNLWLQAGEAATKAQFDVSKQPELNRGGINRIYTYCEYYGPTAAPPPPPPPAVTALSYDQTVCVSVIDECSPSDAVIQNDWNNFSSHYPNRRFVLLQPSGYASSRLKIPSNYNGDVLSNIRRDNGSTGSREDWFALAGLSSVPQGGVVSLAIDTSGSMTLAQVQASYDFFKTRVANAGLQLVESSMSGERWAPPHDKTMPAFQIPAPPPPPPPPPAPIPAPTTFSFSVSPSQNMNFNVPQSYGDVCYSYTITCSSGSGTVTVQETSRPTAWAVLVDGKGSSNIDSGYAVQNYSLSAGQSVTVSLCIRPLTVGSGSGSFAFLKAEGDGQRYNRSWTGTFRTA